MIIAVALFLSFVFLYFYNLGINELWMPNEALTADGVREILKGASPFAPPYNGDPFLHKPPMTQWISTLGVLIFGLNEFGLRFLHGAFAVGTALITSLFAREFFSWKTSLLAGLIFLSSVQIYANARMSTPEIPFTFFITLSLYLWFLGYSRKKDIFILLAFFVCSLAMLTKWLPGLLIPSAVAGLYILLRNPKEAFRKVYAGGVLLTLAPFGIWFLYMVINVGESFLQIFYYENFKKVYDVQKDPFYLHFATIPVTFFPYSFLIYIASLWTIISRRRELLLFTIWFLLILIVFSLVEMKLPTYIMPAFPAMAIITAHFLKEGIWEKIIIYSNYLILFLGAIALFGIAFLTTVDLVSLILATALLPISLKAKEWLKPAFVGLALILYSVSISLPYLESFRHQKEIGEIVRLADPNGQRSYFIGGSHFFESQPYYSGKKVIFAGENYQRIRRGSFALVPEAKKESLEGCYPLWSGKLFLGSETRIFKFLMGIKKGEGMKEYTLCLLPS